MNARKKGEDAGRSGLARSKLFRALGHAHNPFSVDLRKDHDEGYMRNDGEKDFGAINIQAEMAEAEANLLVYNLISRSQKS